MQEGYKRPSFGLFTIRAAAIGLGVVLLGFIIWGLFKLADGSSFWGSAFRVLLVLGVLGAIGFGVFALLKFLQTRSVSLNVGRIIGLALGFFLLVFIVWGVIKLASSDNSSEVVQVSDSENSTITVDGPASGTTEVVVNDTDEDDSITSPSEEHSSTAHRDDHEATPNTGPAASSPLPNTGIEDGLLPALALGSLAYAAVAFRKSQKQLARI